MYVITLVLISLFYAYLYNVWMMHLNVEGREEKAFCF